MLEVKLTARCAETAMKPSLAPFQKHLLDDCTTDMPHQTAISEEANSFASQCLVLQLRWRDDYFCFQFLFNQHHFPWLREGMSDALSVAAPCRTDDFVQEQLIIVTCRWVSVWSSCHPLQVCQWTVEDQSVDAQLQLRPRYLCRLPRRLRQTLESGMANSH